MSESAFTAEMHRQAENEGWWLAQRSDGFYGIERFDEDPSQRFTDDLAALRHVVERASQGSELHRLALELDGTSYVHNAERDQ